MNRRDFLRYLGECACVLAIAGCAYTWEKRKEAAMSKDKFLEESIGHKDWDISVCGLNCALCKTAELGKCQGCRGPLNQCWTDCEFKPCALAKGHRYCFQCDEFPCDKLQAFAADGHEHHHLAVENMKRMRELGLDKWIAEQPKPMYCPGWFF